MAPKIVEYLEGSGNILTKLVERIELLSGSSHLCQETSGKHQGPATPKSRRKAKHQQIMSLLLPVLVIPQIGLCSNFRPL
jgi:hypothetical protein